MMRTFSFLRLKQSVALAAAMMAAHAQADVVSEVSECRTLNDSLQRLVCYDNITLDRPAAPEAPPSPPAVSASNESAAPPSQAPETPAVNADDEFGKEIIDARSGPKSIESRIVSEFTGWRKGEVFELENGQQWVQTDSQEFRIRDQEKPMASIKRKAFGSYRISIEGSNRSVRVRRIR